MCRIYLLLLAVSLLSSFVTNSPVLDVPTTRSPAPQPTAKTNIIGGDIATPGSTPWLVSIRDTQYYPPPHFCGGTILNNFWILTTASCVTSSSYNLLVVLGEYNLDEEEGYEISRTPLLSIIHPKYTYFSTHAYNAALLLVPYFSYGERIQPASLLPKFDDKRHRLDRRFTDRMKEEEGGGKLCKTPDAKRDLQGVEGLIAGWGRTNSEEFSSVVMEANLTIQSNDFCQSAYPDDDMESLMCAADVTHGGVGACMGDSGGGLISKDGYILGIYSYAEPCASDEFPGIYVNMSAIQDWLCSIVRFPHPMSLLAETTDYRMHSYRPSLD
ncbi:trypsin II-P29-like [Macrobrachium rosenbergii]|uniref:trypsin II-P29-like n=1 Tax=Macrobrachium rosenbergii TaxID=79674 RepID=UPI0034D3C005